MNCIGDINNYLVDLRLNVWALPLKLLPHLFGGFGDKLVEEMTGNVFSKTH